MGGGSGRGVEIGAEGDRNKVRDGEGDGAYPRIGGVVACLLDVTELRLSCGIQIYTLQLHRQPSEKKGREEGRKGEKGRCRVESERLRHVRCRVRWGRGPNQGR